MSVAAVCSCHSALRPVPDYSAVNLAAPRCLLMIGRISPRTHPLMLVLAACLDSCGVDLLTTVIKKGTASYLTASRLATCLATNLDSRSRS